MRMGRRVRMKVSLDQLYSVKLSHIFETMRNRRKEVFPGFHSKIGELHTWNIMTLLSLFLPFSPLCTRQLTELYTSGFKDL